MANLHLYPSEMAQNFWTAIWAFSICLGLTVAVSLVTRARREEELVGLVFSLTPKIDDPPTTWLKSPVVLGMIVLAVTLVLNIIFR